MEWIIGDLAATGKIRNSEREKTKEVTREREREREGELRN